jgi:hypothetical protein
VPLSRGPRRPAQEGLEERGLPGTGPGLDEALTQVALADPSQDRDQQFTILSPSGLAGNRVPTPTGGGFASGLTRGGGGPQTVS